MLAQPQPQPPPDSTPLFSFVLSKSSSEPWSSNTGNHRQAPPLPPPPAQVLHPPLARFTAPCRPLSSACRHRRAPSPSPSPSPSCAARRRRSIRRRHRCPATSPLAALLLPLVVVAPRQVCRHPSPSSIGSRLRQGRRRRNAAHAQTAASRTPFPRPSSRSLARFVGWAPTSSVI